jgi:kynurenine formamidase
LQRDAAVGLLTGMRSPARRRTFAFLLAACALAATACQMVPSGVPLLGVPHEPKFPDEYTVLDLTRPLDHDTPFVPHAEAFPFERVEFKSARRAGWRTGAFSGLEHMGTHLATALAHLPIGRSTDQVLAPQLVVPAVVIDLPPTARDGATVSAADVQADEQVHGRVPAGSLVILRTGRGALASTDASLLGRRANGGLWFPGWSEEAVRFLAAERRVRAVGTDAMAVDSGANVTDAPAQSAGGALGLWFVVGLADLSKLPYRGAVVVVGAVPIVGAAGAPARVLAFVPPKAQ